MIDADLADYTSYGKDNDGYKYFLLCIDVFSRYVWVKDMKSAFGDLYEEGLKAEHVRTDKGKEFYGETRQWFKSKKIEHYVTQNETKANYAERAIKTIKKKIARYGWIY
jgi:hypothetical protein